MSILEGSDMTEAAALAQISQFVADIRWDDLPTRVQDRTRARLLDGIAAALIGRDSPATGTVLAFPATDLLGGGNASYWLADRTGAADACAFVNSMTMHSILHEDGGPGGHPSSHTIPAAVAVAEALNRTGADLLTGIAGGYEVQARMGHLTDLPESRSMRGTIMVGCFGATTATVKVAGASVVQVRNALGLASSLAFPAIFGPVVAGGGNDRVLQVGANTRNGVLAGLLATHGFVSTPDVWDGPDGFFEMLFGRPGDRPEITNGLGSTWRSEANIVHPYPTGGGNLGTIYAALKLVRDEDLDPDAIDRIEILHPWWRKNPMYAYTGPFELVEQIITSAPYGVSCCLLYGSADWEALKRGMADDRVTALARKTKVLGIHGWTLTDGEVAVTMRDGQVLRADSRDFPEDLLKPSWAATVDRLAERTPFISDAHRDAIVSAVETLTAAGGVPSLAAALRRPVVAG
jgi:2-methylcitrate dehydratase PrpD